MDGGSIQNRGGVMGPKQSSNAVHSSPSPPAPAPAPPPPSYGNVVVRNGGSSHSASPLLRPGAKKGRNAEASSDLEGGGGGAGGGPVIRTYLWRWVVLGVFSLNNAVTNYVWIMSAIIADVMVCYYDVSTTFVNLLSTSYMMVYVLLMFPTAWLMDKYGLRLPVVLASAAMTLGAALRVMGTGAENFWLVLLGQFIAALSNSVFFGGGPLLSETWFPNSERATATAISSSITPQLGILVAMGLTPVVIHSSLTQEACNSSSTSPEVMETWKGEIYHRWLYYQSAVAGLTMLTLLLTLVTFRDAPPTPPSVSRQLEKDHHDSAEGQEVSFFRQFLNSILGFLKNTYFMIFLIPSGIFLATAGAISSIINEIVAPFFPGKDEQIGYLGVVGLLVSSVSMFFVGRILDRWKNFYCMSVSIGVAGALSLTGLVVLILYQHQFYFLYPAVILVGTTINAYQALAYEYALEMTYPLPEAITTGLVNAVSQVISVAMILLVTPAHTKLAMWFVVGVTAFGASLTVVIKPRLRRVEVERKI